jgi:hypothetical protein
MTTMPRVTFLSAALCCLGLAASAAESNKDTPPPAPSTTGETSASAQNGTGDNAECPIKKTIDGKTYCFQNIPALDKPQGGN